MSDALPVDEPEFLEETVADTETTAAVRLGMLHTVPALAARFDADLATAAPGSTAVHVVDANLLATAIATGVDAAIDAAVAAHVAHLAASGVDAVLVTCSSIGESVELAAAAVDVPVVRVDAAMASRAIDLAGAGGRIVVLATNTATPGPTGRLLERAGAAVAPPPSVRVEVVEGAASARAAGDVATHDSLIADAVRTAAGEADVIVLAQASMAPAAEGAGVDVPVLTSPESALQAAIDAARGDLTGAVGGGS
jgi:aspartate/glutamate racemase